MVVSFRDRSGGRTALPSTKGYQETPRSATAPLSCGGAAPFNLSYWPIKLVFGNCKYVNFHRYRDFEKIVEDIDLSRIVGRMEGLSIDPATAAS